MITPSRILWRFLIAIAIVALLPLWLPLALRALGYYVNQPGWKIAEEIAQEGRSVDACSKIVFMPWRVFSPSSEEQRKHCIYEYASLTQDPTACELLLPGDYGWSCLGTVANILNEGFGCSSYQSGEIYCSSGIRGQNIGIDDCEQYREVDLRQWCYKERTRTLDGVYDCDRIPIDPPILRDECQRWYAYKMRESSLCNGIQNEKLRKACELKIKYLR